MRLSNITKVALLDCETIEEAAAVLQLAFKDEQTIEQRLQQLQTEASALQQLNSSTVQSCNQQLQEQQITAETRINNLRRKTDSKLLGERAPDLSPPIKLADAKAFITNECYNNKRPFTGIDLAQYFDTSTTRASAALSMLWNGNKDDSPWSWFRDNFSRHRDGMRHRYVPHNAEQKRGERTIAMGTSTGFAEKVKSIPAQEVK